ncbi:MAG: winged helix-turn-helix transcriptional regulator [Phycisphaerae bacterium]|nr:winged helix-turn-helix transcriptional regulator [Phycisphaerae bacterium]
MSAERQLARIMQVLSVETRVRIVRLLKGRAMCVGALASRLKVTAGAVSQHLRVMRDAGLVIDEKRGYHVHYRLNEKTLTRWRGQIDDLLTIGPSRGCGCARRSDAGCQTRKS